MQKTVYLTLEKNLMKGKIMMWEVFGVGIMLGIIIYITRNSCHTSSLSDDLSKEAIYRATHPHDFLPDKNENCINLSTMDKNTGFIHLAFGSQVPPTLDKFFNEHPMVLLLELNTKKLEEYGAKVHVEPNKPGGTFYPHLHGTQAIPTAAVNRLLQVKKRADGAWHVTKKIPKSF